MAMSGVNEDDSAQPSERVVTGASVTIGGRSYLRAPVPVRFPESEVVPESKRHLEQRTTLYQILKLAFAERAAIGCDQFVYWDPTSPSECLAPDAFVRLGVRDDYFRSWKVWERGAPEVAVEIISESDERDRDWDAKLAKYRRLGVQELVRFDPECEPASLRIWDAVDGDLLERDLATGVGVSRCLPGAWVIVPDLERGALLRLSRDPEGRSLYPTPVEEEAAARAREASARATAESRVRELEAQLRRRG
jgi:Uma2 family endonuclease